MLTADCRSSCRVRTAGGLRLWGHEALRASKGRSTRGRGRATAMNRPPHREKKNTFEMFSWRCPRPPEEQGLLKPEFSLLCAAWRLETSREGEVWLHGAYLHARAPEREPVGRDSLFKAGGACRIPPAPRAELQSLSPGVNLFPSPHQRAFYAATKTNPACVWPRVSPPARRCSCLARVSAARLQLDR